MNLETLTDDQLLDFLNTAYGDLANAARDCPESEWHQSCFAATVLLGLEVQRRGLVTATKH